MTDPLALSLNDLIGLHYKQVDLLHKFWNYMWLARAAAVTISVSTKSRGLSFALLAGFLPFALTNMWLVFDTQKEASLSANAIRAVAKSCDPPPIFEVSAVLQAIKLRSPWLVAVLHSLLAAFAVFMLWPGAASMPLS